MKEQTREGLLKANLIIALIIARALESLYAEKRNEQPRECTLDVFLIAKGRPHLLSLVYDSESQTVRNAEKGLTDQPTESTEDCVTGSIYSWRVLGLPETQENTAVAFMLASVIEQQLCRESELPSQQPHFDFLRKKYARENNQNVKNLETFFEVGDVLAEVSELFA